MTQDIAGLCERLRDTRYNEILSVRQEAASTIERLQAELEDELHVTNKLTEEIVALRKDVDQSLNRVAKLEEALIKIAAGGLAHKTMQSISRNALEQKS